MNKVEEILQDLHIEKMTLNKALHIENYNNPNSKDYFILMGRIEEINKIENEIRTNKDKEPKTTLYTQMSYNGNDLTIVVRQPKQEPTILSLNGVDGKVDIEQVRYMINVIGNLL